VITSGTGRTVKSVLPETLPAAAEIVEEPEETEVARPAEEIVAMEVFEEPQVTELVRLLLLPSE
jgi:hypothetical protein